MDFAEWPREKREVALVAGILTLVLVAALVWLADWRYKFRFSTPSTAQFDRGFRFNHQELRCQDSKGASGDSEGFFGNCGVMKGQSFRRVKFVNYVAVAFTGQQIHFDRFYFEWLDGLGARWRDSEFANGEFFEVDMPFAHFKNVVFDRVNFVGARLFGATFEDCIFRDTTFIDTTFRDAKFIRTRFERSDCDLCDFASVKFVDSDIQGPMKRAYYNEETVLPFPIEEAGIRGFEYRK